MTRPAALDEALAKLRDARAALPNTLSEVSRAAKDARAAAVDADELRRRAAAVAAIYRAKRIAVYSLDDVAALNSLAELVDALIAAQEGPHG